MVDLLHEDIGHRPGQWCHTDQAPILRVWMNPVVLHLPFLWLQDFAELVSGAEDLCPGKLASPERLLSKVESPLG